MAKTKTIEPSLKENPNNVFPDPELLWVNKKSGVIGRVISKTNNDNICEFWLIPSGNTTPIPQLAINLEKLNYKGKDLSGYDPINNTWKQKNKIGKATIMAMVWKDNQIMLELDDHTTVPISAYENKAKGKPKPIIKNLDTYSITINPALQMRVKINHDTVGEYSRLMVDNDIVFPPITVFTDNEEIWLVDGFHRYFAYQLNKVSLISCEIHQGTFEDAKLYSYSVNSTHGMPRSKEDKNKVVLSAFKDPLLKDYSNREIAKLLNVSRRFVDKLRLSLELNENNNKISTIEASTVAENIDKALKNIKTTIDADVTKSIVSTPESKNNDEETNTLCNINIYQNTLDKLRLVKEKSNLKSLEDTINYLIDIYMKTT